MVASKASTLSSQTAARIKEDCVMIQYNTLMGVASGAALLLLVMFAYHARRSDRRNEGFRPGA